MKNIYWAVATSLIAFGSFYWGQRVASDQVWTTCYALDASHAAHILSMKNPDDISVEEYKRKIESNHLYSVRDGFIGLGRLNSEPSSVFPFLVGDREFAIRMLSLALSRYPEIEDLKPQKIYPEIDKLDKFSNNRVEWFYDGVSLVKQSGS